MDGSIIFVIPTDKVSWDGMQSVHKQHEIGIKRKSLVYVPKWNITFRSGDFERFTKRQKAVELLTISPENRLRKQVAEQEV